MKTPIRILVLSAGDGTGINFCNSLKLIDNKYHVIGVDTNIYRIHYATADEKFLLPDPNKEEYWPSLLKLIKLTAPDFIYASDTNKELEQLSNRRDEVPISMFLPPKPAIAIYEDKWLSYQYFKANGIKVPETLLINEEKDINYAIGQFGNIWLRSTHGSGGNGSISTNDPLLAKAWINRYNGWGHFTAAEVLTKTMATWIGLWINGRLAVCQGRYRLHWEYSNLSPSGVTGITGAQSTTSNALIHEIALKAIHSIPHRPHGIVSVDFTFDSNGIPNPTEIQASRFYSSIYFLAKAGLNFPDIYVEMGLTGNLPYLEPLEHPLTDDLVWLKTIDFTPKLITLDEIAKNERNYRIIA